MNEPKSDLPPLIPEAAPSTGTQMPLGSTESERLPIAGMLGAFESILRQPRRVLYNLTQANAGKVIGALLLLCIIASCIYGVIVGTFSGQTQLWASPVKITVGLLISAGICLPSLYIFSCLSGSRARFYEVVGLVAGLLALLTVLLIGFAPVAWIFSQSTDSVVAMGVLHLSFFAIAIYFGLRFLNSGFSHFTVSFGHGIKLWMAIFIVVVLQMTTAVRPIIGTAPTFLPTEKKFFTSHWNDCLTEQRVKKSTGTDSPSRDAL